MPNVYLLVTQAKMTELIQGEGSESPSTDLPTRENEARGSRSLRKYQH
jgi:hypothetical protein